MGLFGGSFTNGGPKRPTLSKIRHTYPTMMKLGTVVPDLKKIQKYINYVIHPMSSAEISIFFTGNQQLLLHQEIHILSNFLIRCNFDDVSKIGYSRPS